MQQILVYADSLSWGIIPNTRERLPFDERWPGVLENMLNQNDKQVRIIEDCLNGRRTVWDDPFKQGRNGAEHVSYSMEKNSPLSMVLLMLGTNDYQSMHTNNAWHSSQGLVVVINKILSAPIEPGMPRPKLMVIIPPLITEPKGSIAPKFLGAEKYCLGMVEAYTTAVAGFDCLLFDSNSVITSSKIDGIHLDKEQHHVLGNAIANEILPYL